MGTGADHVAPRSKERVWYRRNPSAPSSECVWWKMQDIPPLGIATTFWLS